MLVPAHTGGADLSISSSVAFSISSVPAHTGGADLSLKDPENQAEFDRSPPTRAGRI